jgi:3-oxoacyl-(acyl-carrier-protein) synthase/aryl carrier-like protein
MESATSGAIHLNELTQWIIRNTVAGKIDKQVAAELIEKLLSERQPAAEPVAIIGIAVKMPMADSSAAFWRNLCEGADCIGEFPVARRRDSEALVLLGSNLRREEIRYYRGGFLGEIDQFDHRFFGFSPKEAELMDPNQRLFLETAWEALEDAGYGGEKLSGSRTGVYLGHSSWPVYESYIVKTEPESVALSVPGNFASIIASRLSHLLDLKGPCLTVDTACSGSLVAVHLACRAIRSGECDQALAGGVRINFMPAAGLYEAGIESPRHRIRSFAEDADGTVWGEGVAAVLLKPLNRAVADRDPIYAVIKASAISQNGTTPGITTPNALAIEAAASAAWNEAGVDPATISYLEAFGSGTKLGDSIELSGLQRAFRKATEARQFCGLGSVKPNIGHLDSVAGLAGLIKAALALKHRQLPPLPHFTKPNRSVGFELSPFFVNDRLRPWENGDDPRRCGVNAYSFSGTNCHIVLEEAPELPGEPDGSPGVPCLLTVSAKTEAALRSLLARYRTFLDEASPDLNLGDLCFTAQTGRGHYQYRLALLFRDRSDLRRKLGSDSWPPERAGEMFYGAVSTMGDPSLSALSDQTAVAVQRFLDSGRRERSVLNQLCGLYIQGAAIDWETFWQGEIRRRIHIPVYPFERIRCWLEPREIIPGSAVAGKMVTAGRMVKVRLSGDSSRPISPLEQRLADLWGNTLGLAEIDRHANFMAIGGNSLFAMRIAAVLEREFGRKVEVAELLSRPTIPELAGYLQTMVPEAGSRADGFGSDNIPRLEPRDYYPVSSAQKRLYFISRLEGTGISYNMPGGLIINGPLDRNRVETAVAQLVNRHEAFRTSFELIDEEPVQRVWSAVPFGLERLDGEESQLRELLAGFIRPFDLSEPPLFRAALIGLGKERHALLYDMHHIISDGTSLGILVREFIDLYCRRSLAPLALQYRDFAVWQNELLAGGRAQAQEDFWRNRFSGKIPALNLPTDFPRPALKSFRGDRVAFTAGTELCAALKTVLAETGATLFMALMAAYFVLLSKYSGQEDLIVGIGIAGRTHADLEGVIGYFVNSLPIRCRPEPGKPFRGFLGEVRDRALEAYRNQDYPFEMIVDKLQIGRDPGRNPLFDAAFVLQNMGAPRFDLPDLEVIPYDIDFKTAKFDLTLYATENGGEIAMSLEYCTDLFKRETIVEMAGRYLKILDLIASHPGLRIGAIEIIDQRQREQVAARIKESQRQIAVDVDF